MKPQLQHKWDVTTAEAREIQNRLRPKVRRRGKLPHVKHVAGIDISIRNNRAIAAIPVLSFDDLQIVDLAIAEQAVPFPYVPGLLSFREIPSILAAAEKLTVRPDLMLVDGQGIAHPRRFGLAAHLGVLFDVPTVGCAKTRFIGTHDEPAEQAGCYTDLWDGEELIGAVLRTRDNVKPLYISVGHKIDLPTALDMVLACGGGYRLPEPTRLAHQAAGGTLRRTRRCT
ncbi:MAG: deoxyribonuclease V [Pirellulales bacterium]|nr:deoxyribonuclease V [Pirellulales bacterium]